MDELKALCQQMQKDGLIPIAFADKDGWPAMGTFDVLNMRDQRLPVPRRPDGAQGGRGTTPRSRRSSRPGPSCCPTTRPTRWAAPGRRLRSRCRSKKAGMYLLGLFVTQQFDRPTSTTSTSSPSPRSTRPIGSGRPRRPDRRLHDGGQAEERGRRQGAADVARHQGGAATSTLKTDPSDARRRTRGGSTAAYTALQKKSAELVGSAKNIAQFLDRDTRPDFASTVMIPAHPDVPQEPEGHRRALKSIESQAKSIFTA